MISYIDTEGLAEVADEAMRAIDELEGELSELLERLMRVPTVTKEWTGNQADYYFSRVWLDKQQYDRFIDELRDVVVELNASAAIAGAYIKTNSM